MTVVDVKKNAEQKMHKSIETLKADLAKVRTGRAHVGILDHIQVDYYGTPTQIRRKPRVRGHLVECLEFAVREQGE